MTYSTVSPKASVSRVSPQLTLKSSRRTGRSTALQGKLHPQKTLLHTAQEILCLPLRAYNLKVIL